MGRIRTIKPEFHAHEALSALPAETHLLAAALTNYADDEGYFNANPALVKAGTHPLRRDATSVEKQLSQLEKIGYIEIRKCPDGRSVGHITTFLTHQRVQHPSSSKLRELYVNSTVILTPEGKGREKEQGTGNREASTAIAVPAANHPRGKLLGTLPLNDGTNYEVREDDLSRDVPLYPAVDVPQMYRAMKGYLLANPAKLKTRGGIRRFMHNWLSKEQDKGGRDGSRGGNYARGINKGQDIEDAAMRTLQAANANAARRGQGDPTPRDADEIGDSPQGIVGNSRPGALLESLGF